MKLFDHKIQKILFIVFLVVVSLSSHARNINVGDIAPGFELKTLEGKKYSLDTLRKDKHVMLVFWAAECVYCYAHVKEFNRAHEKYKDRLTIAAINIGGEYDPEVAEYVKDNDLKYLVLSDRLNNLDVSESYRVLGTPTIVLVSPEGKVIFYGHKMPMLEKLFQ